MLKVKLEVQCHSNNAPTDTLKLMVENSSNNVEYVFTSEGLKRLPRKRLNHLCEILSTKIQTAIQELGNAK